MAISELVDVSISEAIAGTTLATFDQLAIVASASDSTPTSYSAIVAKSYTPDSDGLASMADDWTDSSDAYDAFSQAISQAQKPSAILVIKRGAAVAIEKTVTFASAIASGQTIVATVNGTAISVAFTSDAATTYAAFETAIEAVEGIASATVAGDVITIVASDEWELSVTATATGTGAPAVTVATSVAGRTVADDLADAIAEDDTNTWYGVITADTNKGLILSAAAYIETTEKLYFARTSESATKTAGGTTSLGYRLNALNYRRTLLFWHHDTTEYIDAAALALYLGNEPGSIQLFGRSLTGVTATPTSSLDAAGVTVLEGRSVNTYRKFGAFGAIKKGRRVDGVVVEATRDLDYVRNELREEFLVYLTQTLKPSFDQDGLKAIQGKGEAVARRMVQEGIFRGDVDVTFFVPEFSDIDSSDYAAQLVTGCYLAATLLKGVIRIQIDVQVQL